MAAAAAIFMFTSGCSAAGSAGQTAAEDEKAAPVSTEGDAQAVQTEAAPETAQPEAAPEAVQTEDASEIAQPEEASETAASEAPADYTGKSLTIIGDSISTFYGYIPEGYAFTYPYEDLQDVSQTWWMQVCGQTGMHLYSNASYSGGYVTGDPADETGITAIGRRRLFDAATPLSEGESGGPDVIMILAGTNDCWQARELSVFSDAYDTLLTELSARFPESEIIVLTCLPMLDPNNGVPVTTSYAELSMMQNQNGQNITVDNDLIREAAENHHVKVIDAFNAGLTSEDYLDGVHPNVRGAQKLAQYITDRLLAGPLS